MIKFKQEYMYFQGKKVVYEMGDSRTCSTCAFDCKNLLTLDFRILVVGHCRTETYFKEI